jgi:hypothetical protein
VLQTIGNQETITLNTSMLPAGMYTVNITSEKGSQSQTIVIE